MMAARVVSDAGPLIAYAGIRRLDLIGQIFPRVIVPAAVAHEIRPSVPSLPGWLEVDHREPAPEWARSPGLDAGERAAIGLAMDIAADLLLIDDLKGRVAAVRFGLGIVGSLGLAVTAKRLGLIGQARPLIERLMSNGLYLSDAVYEEAMLRIGE